MDSIKILQTGFVPDFLIRWAIRKRLAKKLRDEKLVYDNHNAMELFIKKLCESQVAERTEKANQQHYELPPEFFNEVLGAHLKYSCGLWPKGVDALDQSEKAMLDLYAQRANLVDGQKILDLGCGWGSLSLYLAQKFPNSQITGVSNSNNQRKWIEHQIKERHLENLKIMTSDVNELQFKETFDRILSIEMFEHMRNYPELFKKIANWLNSEGRLFVHIFCHKQYPYFYEAQSDQDWMAKYFFTGGTMPSYGLFSHFADHLEIEKCWKVNGIHYKKTCNKWLEKMDASKDQTIPIINEVYGKDAQTWWIYWRVFFMACAELFGYNGGNEWFVAHYLFKKKESEFI